MYLFSRNFGESSSSTKKFVNGLSYLMTMDFIFTLIAIPGFIAGNLFFMSLKLQIIFYSK